MEEQKIINIPPVKGYLDYENKKNTSIKAILIYILLMYVINILVQFLLMSISPIVTGVPLYEINELGEEILNEKNALFINSWTQIIIYTTMTISLIYITKRYLILDLRECQKNIKFPIIETLIGIGIFYGISIISELFLKIIEVNDSSANQGAIIEILKGDYGFLVILSIILMGPICEEIIFRQSAFNLFKPHTKAWIKIGITGFIFGFIHVASAIISYLLTGEHYSVILKELLLGVPYILQGMALSYIYYRSKQNIVPVTIIHILNNLLAAINIFLLQ